jgi:uncharacterized protein (TIGR02145 family)
MLSNPKYINYLIIKDNIKTNFDTVKDFDGNIYKTVKIGSQIWLAENLKVTHYNNGDPIPSKLSDPVWSKLADQKTGACSVYNDNPENLKIYGNLYNWYAVNDDRGICPEGFHIPTDKEWMELESYLGMTEDELKSTNTRGYGLGGQLAGNVDLWKKFNKYPERNNSLGDDPNFGVSGFLALPGGSRSFSNGGYNFLEDCGYFWSSTDNDTHSAMYRQLIFYSSGVSRDFYPKGHGFSIRCLKKNN